MMGPNLIGNMQQIGSLRRIFESAQPFACLTPQL